jgi:hypothetical protein
MTHALSDALYLVGGVILIILGRRARNRRRANMTPEQLQLDDIREELRALRREQRRYRT